MPPRPAARAMGPSNITEAMRAPLSPAGPMEATTISSPSSSFRIESVSKVSLPARCEAGLRLGPPSSSRRQTGSSERPRSMTPSYPVKEKDADQCPPAADSIQVPVRGDLAERQILGPPGTGVPLKSPRMNRSGLSGERGSRSGPVSSKRILAESPLPSRKFSTSDGSIPRSSNRPVERSTSRILPW